MSIASFMDGISLNSILTLTVGSLIAFIIIFKLVEETFQKAIMFIMFVVLALIAAVITYKFLF